MKDKIKKYGTEFILVIVLLTFTSQLVLAADVYKPYLHSPILPDNPRIKIQGSFDTALWPGAGIYTYPIEVPPGTNGLVPILSLIYNSQLTFNRPGIIGTAWLSSDNYIIRDVNYSFGDTSNDNFRLILNGQADDLVYNSSDGRYHTKIESFLNIQNVSGGNNTNSIYWIVKKPDGTTYRFGYNNNSELISNLFLYATKWSLDLVTDTHDNKIYYSYLENPFTNDFGAVYLNKIEYNNDKNRVVQFIYETSDRPDKWLVYEQGNKIRESRRLKEININASGNLVKKYIINYTLFDSSARSAVSSITLFGNDGNTSFSSTRFTYYNVTKGWLEDERFLLPSGYVMFEQAGSDYGVRLLDLNRDGLEDITKADALNSNLNQSWVNNGSGWIRNDSWNIFSVIVVDPSGLTTENVDSGLRFIDFNGDGFTDIVRGFGSTKESWQNNMNGWSVASSNWRLPTNAEPVVKSGTQILDRGVNFVDFNNDGLVDILSATDDWNYAWRNNGTGWMLDNSWTVPSSARFLIYPSGEDEGVRLVDVNGDGLVDLIKGKESSSVKIWLNNGTNWIEDASWNLPEGVFFVDSLGIDEGIRLVDINGDGLADILKGNAGNESAWINNGSGWALDYSWNVPERENFVSSDGTNKGVRLVDVNGDGLVDLMKGGTGAVTYVNKARKGYLLKNIANNIGGISNIDYLESTRLVNNGQDNISDIGFNIWVINSLKEDNGLNNMQAINFTIYYQYKNGFFDYYKKEFRGFNQVDEIRPNISIITHMFNQSDFLKGQEYKTEIFDINSRPFEEISYEWNGINKGNYYVIELSKITDSLYDGLDNIPLITKTEYSYDNYGNVINIISYGSNSTQNDERYEYFDYVYNTTSWVVDKIKKYSLYDSDNSTKVREIYYSYDNRSYGATPTKGDLTLQQQWLNSGINITTKFVYDSYGNIIEETDPRGYKTKYTFGFRDTTFTFANQIINPYNHTINYQYNLGTGSILSEQEANGYITNYTYDIFGRIVKEIRPYNSEQYPTIQYTYFMNGTVPNYIKVSKIEQNSSNGTLDSYYFYDGLGNLVQIKSEAENLTQVVIDILYDGEGRVVRQSNPYFRAFSENYSNPNQSISHISYNYDPLSRVTKLRNQDGTYKNISFNIGEVISYDEKGNKVIYSLDAYENVIKVIEYTANNYYTTSYSYNILGDILQINDSYGNIVQNYTYDNLGRKIFEYNMDSGIWKYNYDNSSNLINQISGSSTNSTFEYDGLNRITKRINKDLNITYLYDGKTNGTVASAISNNLTINYTHDKRLRKIKETQIIDGRTFVKDFTYDSLDRMITEKMPDSSIITYSYGFGGLIDNISNMLNDVEYTSVSKPSKLKYANNLNTDMIYNDTLFRINKITTSNKQNLEYSYDSTGNLIFINDTINQRKTFMSYDELRRLISTHVIDNTTDSNSNFSYNALGNILESSTNGKNMSYYYAFKPAHAPSLIRKTIIPLILSNDTYKFLIKNISGGNIAWFGSEGNIVLKGSCFAQSSCTASTDSFIISNFTDSTVAFVNSSGDLCVEKGNCSDHSASCNPSRDAFIIRGSSNTNVSYIDFNGDLCLTGSLTEKGNP